MLSLWVFSSAAAAVGAKEVVGRREWKQPLSPENPEDFEVFHAMLGRQGWCQSPAENRLCCPPPASASRFHSTRLPHQTPAQKPVSPELGTPPCFFPPSSAPKSLKCPWETSGSNWATYSKSEVGTGS